MKILIKLAAIPLLMFISLGAFAERQASDDESHIDDPRVQHRSYSFSPTGETIPYALFVPSTYSEDEGAPLIISLHGLGRSYDWLMGYHGFLDQAEPQLVHAEDPVASPGERVDGDGLLR